MEIVSSEYIFDGEILLKNKAVLLNNSVVVEIGNVEHLKKHIAKQPLRIWASGFYFPVL